MYVKERPVSYRPGAGPDSTVPASTPSAAMGSHPSNDTVLLGLPGFPLRFPPYDNEYLAPPIMHPICVLEGTKNECCKLARPRHTLRGHRIGLSVCCKVLFSFVTHYTSIDNALLPFGGEPSDRNGGTMKATSSQMLTDIRL